MSVSCDRTAHVTAPFLRHRPGRRVGSVILEASHTSLLGLFSVLLSGVVGPPVGGAGDCENAEIGMTMFMIIFILKWAWSLWLSSYL